MKKNKFLVMSVTLLALATGIKAQNNTSWSTTGNIGIGTTTPTDGLHLHNNLLRLTGTTPGWGGPMVVFGNDWGIEYTTTLTTPGLNFWKPFGSTNNSNALLFLKDLNGYMGLNNDNPLFHIDAITPSFLGGELLYSGRASDVPNSRVGFVNSAYNDFTFLPTAFGNIDATQTHGIGFQTIGNIDPTLDVATNFAPITRFISSQGWVYNNTGVGVVANRSLFSWGNAGTTHMLMDVSGQLKLMSNLSTTTVAGQANNRLEITSSTGDPYFNVVAINGASGLRLTNLTNTKTVLANPTNKVLSVDANGDVILVAGGATPTANTGLSVTGTTVQLGIPCTATAAQITAAQFAANRQIPLASSNLIFAANATAGKVGIGLPTNSCVPGNRLEIKGLAANQSGLRFTNLTSISPLTANPGFGVLALNATGDVIYVPQSNFGTECTNVNPYNLSTDWRVGLNGKSMNFDGPGNVNIGDIQGCFAGITSPGRLWVRNTFGNTGPSTALYIQGNGATSSSAAFFDGNVNVNGIGTINAGAWITSDKQFKKEVSNINNAMDLINTLSPKSYMYEVNNKYNIHFYDKKQYGFIAQEVEKVLPELVRNASIPAQYDEDGKEIAPAGEYKTVNYDGFIAIMMQGMKEQQITMDKQQKQIDDLKTLVNSLVKINETITKQNVELSDKNVIVLDQNIPNPFAENTVINYTIPNDFSKAQILFTSIEGKLIKAIDITTKGKGSLSVFANDLTNGIYSYTLVVDGKIIDSKKMIKQ